MIIVSVGAPEPSVYTGAESAALLPFHFFLLEQDGLLLSEFLCFADQEVFILHSDLSGLVLL